jgi:hypothetical protein
MFPANQNEAFVTSFKAEPRGAVRLPFRQVLALAISSTATVLDVDVDPSLLGPRPLAVSLAFMEWRLRALKLTITPNPQLSDVALGYNVVPYETTAPTSVTDVLQGMQCTMIQAAFQTTPASMSIPRRVLRQTMQPWLKCVTSSGIQPQELYHGVLIAFARSSITGAINIIIDGEIEFRTPTESGFSRKEVDPVPEFDNTAVAFQTVNPFTVLNMEEDEKVAASVKPLPPRRRPI